MMGAEELEPLRQQLHRLHEELRQEMRVRWHRDLPLEELLGDRWERARSLGFGEETSIYQTSYVYGDVRVGAHTWIGPFTVLDGTGGLLIGSYCSISSGVQIYTHDTVRWAVTAGRAEAERASVEIGDCCYIGSQTVVAKGVRIGPHSVIGAGSFVNRNIPDNTLAFGTPCRPAGRVEVDAAGAVQLIMTPRSLPRRVRRGRR